MFFRSSTAKPNHPSQKFINTRRSRAGTVVSGEDKVVRGHFCVVRRVVCWAALCIPSTSQAQRYTGAMGIVGIAIAGQAGVVIYILEHVM